ncbi:MAG: ROK family protein [Oscillospiraceae bacterium]|jgi:glucokinase|nr:ROK family protein [Oscillospiraceae bacterium]
MYYIGIDVGGTNLKAGLVDEHYQIAATKKMPLQFTSMEQMGETLADMAIALAEENHIPRSQVASVGMGFPGPVDDRRGVVVKTVNIPIRFMPVAEMFHRRWDVPVHLGNDADCAALGEFYHYEDKDVESLILVTLGTGIGTGIILHGKIHAGINGCAGEGGHMVIVHGGEPCTCGRQGCWERYASANALIRQTRAAMEADRGSAMWAMAGGLEGVDGRTAFAAMREGDGTARAVVGRYLDYLANGLSNLVNIFQPEVISLGGGVSHERDEDLLLPLQGMILEQCFGRESDRHTRLTKAKLGNDAGMIGAALLGL